MTPVTDLAPARPPAAAAPARALPTAARVRDYETTAVLREGPTGIVYVAWDHSLQRKVAIKEYMPAALVARVVGSPAVTLRTERQGEAFAAGLKGFLNEARVLARFDHPSLAKVYRFWEDNGTAYMAMPHYEGPTLETALAELGHVPSESELRTWLRPVLNAIAVLHDGGVWHQNIAPDEIVLTPVGPVLLGFASAAQAIETAQHAPAAALKPGFAAIEQYGSAVGTTRGPWTDLYALASVIYAAITGSAPAPAPERLVADAVLPLSIIAAGLYSDAFLGAIDAAMRVQPESRPRDHLAFRALMGDIEAPEAPVSLAPRRDLMQEPFVGLAADDRQVTVPDRPLLGPAAPTISTVPPVPGSRPRPALPAASRDSASMPLPAERGSPAWIRSTRGEGALGKRAAYGVVAVTCFLVGAVALAIQFTVRQAPAAGTGAALGPGPAAAAARPLPGLSPLTSPAALPHAPTAAAAVTAAPPPPTVATATTSALPTAAANPLPAKAASSAAVTSDTRPAERLSRCTEILQKASLEPISAADTEFYKKECR